MFNIVLNSIPNKLTNQTLESSADARSSCTSISRFQKIRFEIFFFFALRTGV